MIDIIVTCPFCGKEEIVTADFEAYLEWTGGALVQEAFPEMSATEREMLISGLCPDCQKKFFKEF